MKDKIANILKEYTKKNGISASFVILEDYAEELVKNGAELVVKCKDCKHWRECLYDPITERKYGECSRPLGDCGGNAETDETDFCSYGERERR